MSRSTDRNREKWKTSDLKHTLRSALKGESQLRIPFLNQKRDHMSSGCYLVETRLGGIHEMALE